MDESTGMSPHKAEVCATLSPIGKRVFKYVEFDDNEQLIAEIRKHSLGLFFIWLTGLLISFIIFGAVIILALNLDNLGVGTVDGSGIAKTILIALGIVLTIFGILATFISSYIYRSSVVFITNEKISEVLYLSIFNRKVTQLGIGNVEDVAVLQRGILARIFNFGTLVVETAGEIENCMFTYVPNPSINSQLIVKAHEEYVEKYGN